MIMRNLTLTNVVFESDFIISIIFPYFNLTLTSVVFELAFRTSQSCASSLFNFNKSCI